MDYDRLLVGHLFQRVVYSLSAMAAHLDTAEGERFTFSAVSEERPLALALDKTITIWVAGHSLDKRPHKIGMGVQLAGLGDLRFDIVDVVQNE